MKKLFSKHNLKIALKRAALAAFSVLILVALPIKILNDRAFARDYTAEIAAKEREVSAYQAEAGRLASQADSLVVALENFTNEKNQIQAQLDISQAKYDELATKIGQTEKEILENKDALGKTIADIYVSDKVTPIEMVFGSKNVSDFLDKQEFRNSIRDELTSTISSIKKLKTSLETQKSETEDVLNDQKLQRDHLASKEGEQKELVDKTKGQESVYQQLSQASLSQKRQLETEQQAAIAAALRAAGNTGNLAAGDPNRGGYPSNLANSNYYSPVVDPWGMYSRQCVSYTAWKVFQKNGYMPYWGGHGNANQWPASARAAGITTSSTPRAQSVGVMMSGYYGHVVWVESVNDNGTINISQYNELTSAGWGNYSERYNVSPGTYSVYIYF